MTDLPLKVGCISFVNVAPYFFHLAETGFRGDVVAGVPTDLNRRLAAGEIDLSPSSSFEYALHWRDYLLLPGHSISSIGPVQSVLLFSRLPLSEVAGEQIFVTGDSATSVNLMQVLFREFLGAAELCCLVPQDPVETRLAAGESTLLIGDRALRMAKELPAGMQVYDLGELWNRFTGLPFVFGLWIVRRAAYASRREAILQFRRQLDEALQMAFADIDSMAARVAADGLFSASELIDYWRTVSYTLTPAHLEGLRTFFALCFKHGLLAEEPELCFTE